MQLNIFSPEPKKTNPVTNQKIELSLTEIERLIDRDGESSVSPDDLRRLKLYKNTQENQGDNNPFKPRG